jgi:tRNA(adenine34) deaminase
MTQTHEDSMRLALDEANKSGEAVGRPVGSIIVYEGAVVGRSGDRRETLIDPTAHAEVLAIREAARNIRRVDLSGCTLYTTLEPCPMCCGAIIISKISTVVVGAPHTPEERRTAAVLVTSGWTKENELVTGILAQECQAMREKYS